jgi:phosphoribosylglycinamide formyltransferase-1
VTDSDFKLVVLVSGGGSNLQAIIDAITHKQLDAQIELVISDRENAYALTRAGYAEIPALFLNPNQYAGRTEFDDALAEKILDINPDLIILAGFMRILSGSFVEEFQGKIINIHPSLLPAHKGLDTHQRAISAGDTIHGATVHFVTEELDDGPIILQATVPVCETDTADSLQKKVLQQEHVIYPGAIQLIAQGKINFSNPVML